MKLVVLDSQAVNPGDLSWDWLKAFGEVAVYPRTPEEEVVSRIGDAEIVLINKIAMTRQVLERCPNLKLICVQATGYNVVDCQAARELGIPVCNVPDYGTDAVAQFTMGLLLELCHQIGHHNRWVQAGNWCSHPDFCYWETPQMELSGKNMGIIGFGRIGRRVGELAKAFGMEVLAYSRSRTPEGEKIASYVPLEELLEKSQVLSLHCPLTPQTHKIINGNTLNQMQTGAILLNTARGDLVEEAAVASALRTGKLRGYAADVLSREPMSPENPLLGAPNCILTPHMAWAPVESRRRIQRCTQDNIEAFLEGNLIHVVNP